jgi:hypothetical protein
VIRLRVAVAAVCALVLSGLGAAQVPSAWARLQFLVGSWEAVGANQLGSGEGSASFTPELNGQILVRRAFADYKTGPQAGTRHDDLLVIYRDTPDAPARAIYFDSEGHVIRYAITFPRENAAVFESAASEPGPRYRLSYARSGDTLTGTFEIAAPGADYKTYLSWTTVKR